MGILNFIKKRKPNIIMILIDGAARQDTLKLIPFYQELIKESTFCSSIITYAPYSIGALNAMISGMYGNINGVNGYYRSYNFDKENIFTLTQYLKEDGYYTVSDWVIPDVVPTQGFVKTRIFGKEEGKEIDLVSRHSEVITQLKDKQPFFLFLDYNKIALHIAENVIKKYDDFSDEYFKNRKNNFKNYLSWVEESTHYLQKILAKIKELEIYDDSIIIIFSDHGESLGDRKGEKVHGVFLYDYTIKCWTYFIGKQFPKNLSIKETLRHIDIMPTILDILKIKPKENFKPIQGTSIMPFVDGKGESIIAYSETGGLGGPTPSPEIHNVQSVRTNQWKLIYNKTNKKKELYNLEEDKEEKNNLSGKGLEIEEKLWNEMQKINKEHKKINQQFKNNTKNLS